MLPRVIPVAERPTLKVLRPVNTLEPVVAMLTTAPVEPFMDLTKFDVSPTAPEVTTNSLPKEAIPVTDEDASGSGFTAVP